MGVVFLIVIIVIAVWVLASCVRIVPQAYAVILERLGAYQATWSTGIHFKVPFIERVARKVNLKEQVVDFPPQPVITKDNVTMQIDTVVFFQITDPKLYTYGVENPIMAIENLSATTLRNIIGDMELDETLTSRETINTKMSNVSVLNAKRESSQTWLQRRILSVIEEEKLLDEKMRMPEEELPQIDNIDSPDEISDDNYGEYISHRLRSVIEGSQIGRVCEVIYWPVAANSSQASTLAMFGLVELLCSIIIPVTWLIK